MKKVERLKVLAEKLDRSMTLEKFEPRAFRYGPCKCHIVGNLKYSPNNARFVLKPGNGKTITHNLMSVPWSLWAEDAKTDYLSQPGRKPLQ